MFFWEGAILQVFYEWEQVSDQKKNQTLKIGYQASPGNFFF
jgi:hypothetical protein